MQSIQEEIMKMVEVDQAARSESHIDWDKVGVIDRANTKKMKQIVEENGWLVISKVGEELSHAAWLLVQHADHDLEFQKYCLDLMTTLPKEEVSQKDVALLTDRVMMKEKNIQKYGTQLLGKGDHLVMAPVEDLENLDKLRAEVGMQPVREYFKSFSRPVYISEEEYLSESQQLKAA